MKLTIKHQSKEQSIEISPQATMHQLRERIYELTSVAVVHQKLLLKPAKGVKISGRGNNAQGCGDVNLNQTLAEMGVTQGLVIMVLGATQAQVDKVNLEEQQASRWKQPRSYHPSLLQATRPHSTGVADLAAIKQPFLAIKPHQSLNSFNPLFARVTAYLERLANDQGVVHVCRLHSYTVGLLTELLPWENSDLLGLNENHGQVIRLRIRTDNADGFRDYKTTRQVLMHELAHIDIGGHPVEFRELNSKLNSELAAHEKKVFQGTHSLHNGDMYVPRDDATSDGCTSSHKGTSYKLGGSATSIHGDGQAQPLSADPISSEGRRQAVLQATLRRLAKVEAEIETRCGSDSPSKIITHHS